MDSRKVASELIELSGGTSNIKNVTHCSTRLRFIIKDKSAVEVEAIKKCEGVLGVVFTTDELQMVFGKNVIPVYTEASKIYEAAGNKAGGVVPDMFVQLHVPSPTFSCDGARAPAPPG